MLVLPAAAGASVDPGSALHAYMRGRLADDDGAPGLALTSYRQALAGDPASLEVARRSYFQAVISGDMGLALRSAAVLESDGILPRDGTLLQIADALNRKDWAGARLIVDRMVAEGNFAFLAPIMRSWISVGEGRYAAPVIDPTDRFASLAKRYLDEHLALQALRNGDLQTARPSINQALALRTAEANELRLLFAGQLAARGARADALALLPETHANFAQAREDIARGKALSFHGKALTAGQGFARLLTRLAADISSDGSTGSLGIRLARIAAFADPAGAAPRIVAADLLSRGGYAAYAVEEARKVPGAGWYGALGQAELVEALAAAGQRPEAVTLAHALAAVPNAEPERHVRLGQLLMQEKDYRAAASAFRAAQAGYSGDAVPWALLLFEGSALEQGAQWDQARAVLERAAKLAPNEPAILNYLGYAQIERRQNMDAALELLKKASALKPQDASITDSLGWAQFVTGDIDAAVPILERAAAGAPSDATINEHLGDALWAAGRRYEARYAWRAAAVFAEGETAQRLAAKTREGMKPEYAAR
ncbi:tetratricopeptide repeat protein [Sphingobium fuliginis]|uniref:Tetratricopeptide repeat protein n=1 Tax=Sphingobium fuliginis ATCC 27551 TaxID=1208342 RepID=A0A5B8CFW4_SPHSA|nr:tetratricopeptide repeat protein [Sphingobium fuliginis]QDC37156.1 tetratricopeptide repeat protein [Sphingobium fuliginis ATCC 27551]